MDGIIADRTKLLQAILPKYRDRTVRGKAFEEFVEDFISASATLRAEKPSAWDYFHECLRGFAGVKLTGETLLHICWRFAGNKKQIYKGHIKPWSGQFEYEWAPAVIVRARLSRGGKKGRELGHDMTFRIMGGTPAGMLVRQWWSNRKCYFMAFYKDEKGYGFGFTKVRSNKSTAAATVYPYTDARLFVTLRCILLMDPELSDSEPVFSKIVATSATTQYNRQQHRRRARREPQYACPRKFPLKVSCASCPVGYVECPAAVHRELFKLKVCKQCGEKEFHDPEEHLKMCVGCAKEFILKPEGE